MMTKIGKNAEGKLVISLVKGLGRVTPTHRATIRSLGLNRIGQQVVQSDNEAIRGMVRSVGFMLKVENAQ